MLYTNNYRNCSQLVLSAMLKRVNIPVDKILHQNGLIYKDCSSEVLLTPYYRSIEEDILHDFGVSVNRLSFKKPDYWIQVIQDLLASGNTVGVYVDIFELDHAMYYKDKHEWHMFEIVGYENNLFRICDHYYHHCGDITTDRLIEMGAPNLHWTQDNRFQLIYCHRIANVQRQNLEEICQENLDAMNGSSQGDDESGRYITGYPAVERFSESLLKMFEAGSVTDHTLDRLYYASKEVSNSRQNYSAFLSIEDCQELATELSYSAQLWTAIANMIIKTSITRDFKTMGKRIFDKFEKVKEHEMKVIVLHEALLKKV